MTRATAVRDIKLVAIGNSRGIRLPKGLLQKYGWTDSLVLEETENGVFLYGKEQDKLSLMAPFPRRYAIYFADLNPAVGGEIRKVRPVVVVSQTEMNRFLETVVVCPLTSTLHPEWRSRLQIRCAGKDAEIAVDQIRAISKRRLRRRLDRLSDDDAAQLRRIITAMYGS